MHLSPGVVQNFPKAVGNPKNSGLSSQQKMVVNYPRTVWKNSYAEHEVTDKTYN